MPILAVVMLMAAGCDRSTSSSEQRPTVTLYCSVDDPSEILAAFTRETGIEVRLKTDTEAAKTTGLARLIEAERDRPQADVFWSSEVFNTIQMARKGLFAEYRPPAEGIPDRYRDPGGRWTAFGLRGRVLGYRTELDKATLPTRWREIADEKWKGRIGVADPRFGTTRGHFAAMLALWGEPEYVQFLKELSATAGRLLDGNATSAAMVGRGELALAATDTDDVYARQARGEPIDMVYPDMSDGGTLLIPNSVAIIANAPNRAAAEKLVDYLTSAAVERALALSPSRNIPVRESLREELKITMPPESKVDLITIANHMEKAIQLAGEHLKR